MKFFNTPLVMVLFVAMSQLSASDAHARRRSRTESGSQDITALVASLRAVNATASPACDDGKHGCIDCTVKGKCDSGTLKPDGKCPAGEACIVVGSTPVCKTIAQTKCNCGGGSKGCDAFTNRPIFCVAGKVFLDKACEDTQQCSGAGECVVGETTVNPPSVCAGNKDNKYFLQTPACTTGVFCAEEDEVDTKECKKTEYFDLKSSSCKAFPPPNPCVCGKPKCPILGDCSKYAVCEGDTLIDEESCTEADANQFDFTNETCVVNTTALTGLCLDYKGCTFPTKTSVDNSSSTDSSSTHSSTTVPTTTGPTTTGPTTTGPTTTGPTTTGPTTTGPSTTTTTKPPTCNATNAGRRYPHETDKCKKYYTCRLISSGRYGYVEGKCIGNLVFNPANSYCDLPDNVLACKQ